jgi:hypothetical protein
LESEERPEMTGVVYFYPEDDTAGCFRVQEVDERAEDDRPGRIVRRAPLSFGHPRSVLRSDLRAVVRRAS